MFGNVDFEEGYDISASLWAYFPKLTFIPHQQATDPQNCKGLSCSFFAMNIPNCTKSYSYIFFQLCKCKYNKNATIHNREGQVLSQLLI